jgi:O-antigen/teichoic acid export membrane protein
LTEDAQEHTSTQQVARRAVLGAAALAVRQIVVQLFNLGGSIVLARQLSPREYGFFGIIQFLLSFLSSFGDVGLGASLIRQEKEPEERDYRAVFTFQQLLVLGVVLVVVIAAPWLVRHYHVPDSERYVFHVAVLSLLLTSFQSIPALRLERKLSFDRLAIIDTTQSLSFNVVAIVLALKGFGVWSFVIALLMRSALGAVMIQWVSQWRIGWVFDWPRIRAHMAFGVPYQAINFISLIKDSITPVLVGSLAGLAAVGYISWSNTVAAYSVLALMVFQRVYLPAFARLQGDRKGLGEFVERVVWATNAICAPLALLMLALFEPFTVQVFGSKWLVAKPYFHLLWCANLVVPTATPMLGLLNALGRAKTSMLFAFVWMAGTWLIGAPLIVAFGGIGFAIANAVVQLTNFALFRVAQKLVPFRILVPILPAWSIAACIGAMVWFAQRHLPVRSLPVLGAYVVTGIGLYLLGLRLFDGPAISQMRQLVRRTP